MSNTLYFPAVSLGALFSDWAANTKVEGKSFRFYDQKSNPFYNYGKLLISAGHNFRTENFSEKMGIDPSKNILLGDSGGFQLVTKVLDYSDELRKNLFDWLEQNTTYASNLDLPPFLTGGNAQNDLFFAECLNQTIKNMDFFEKNQSGKTKFLNVIHGRTQKQVNIWYDKVKNFNFPGGWAIGGSNSVFFTLFVLFYLLDNGEFDRYRGKGALFHIFGVSSLSFVAILMYFQNILNKLNYDITISFDSSSPILTTSFGNYYSFGCNKNLSLNKICISTSIKDVEKFNLASKLPCHCPVCSKLSWDNLFKYRKEKNGKISFRGEFYSILSLHNLYTYLQLKINIENLIKLNSIEILESLLNLQLCKIFSSIDLIFESAPGGRSKELYNYKEVFKNFIEKDEIESISSLLF